MPVTNHTLHCVGKQYARYILKLTELKGARALPAIGKRQIDVFDLLIKVRLFTLDVHRLLKLNLVLGRCRV